MRRHTTFAAIVAAILIAATALSSLSCASSPAPSPTSVPAGKQAEPTKAAAAAPAATAPAAPAQAQPTAAASPAETIKLGIAASLTGGGARIGITVERLIRMGIADVNAKGGFKVAGKTYKYESVTADDKYTSEGGREAANKLILADKAQFVIGPVSSPTAGAETVTEAAKKLLIATTAQDKALGPNFPLTLVVGIGHVRMRSPAMYEWLGKAFPNAKRVAVVTTDDAAGQGYFPVIEDVAKDKGLTLLTKELTPVDTKDHGPLATRMLRLNPDVIDLGTVGGQPANFSGMMKALWDQGYRGPVLGYTMDMGTFRDGGAPMQNVVTAVLSTFDVSAVSDGERQILQRYIQQYGEAALEPTALGAYDQPRVLAQALEKVGGIDDAKKISDTLRAGEWDAMSGKVKFLGAKTFGLPSVLQQTIYLSHVESGKVVTFQGVRATMP